MRWILGISVLLGFGQDAFSQEEAKYFFGHIDAPCHPTRKDTLIDVGGGKKALCAQLLEDIRKLENCSRIEAPCPEGQRILSAIYGDTQRSGLPDVLLYLDQNTASPDTFKASRPVLMFKGQNTPYVFGVRDVYALVFSEKKACLGGTVATEFRSDPNPLTAILAVLGKTFPGPKDNKDDREPLNFTWYPLSGNPSNSVMWYAVARAGIDVGSTNRMTIYYRQPNAPKKEEQAAKADAEKKAGAAKPDPAATPKPAPKPGPGVEDECAPVDVQPGKDGPVHTANFLAANAFFSDSSESQVALGLAVGVTFNAENTSLASGGSDAGFNGYGLVKYYFLERFRPRLYAGPTDVGSRRPSLALVLGTNVFKDPFKELLLGVSLGHLVANVGLTVGINSIEGKADSDQGRKERMFLGIDYSF